MTFVRDNTLDDSIRSLDGYFIDRGVDTYSREEEKEGEEEKRGRARETHVLFEMRKRKERRRKKVVQIAVKEMKKKTKKKMGKRERERGSQSLVARIRDNTLSRCSPGRVEKREERTALKGKEEEERERKSVTEKGPSATAQSQIVTGVTARRRSFFHFFTLSLSFPSSLSFPNEHPENKQREDDTTNKL